MLYEKIKTQVSRIIDKGVIQPYSSLWNSLLRIVLKRAGLDSRKQYRLVIDFRKINKKTIPYAYPTANIHEISESLQKSKFLSIIDLVSGFHQVSMIPDSPLRPFLALRISHGALRPLHCNSNFPKANEHSAYRFSRG